MQTNSGDNGYQRVLQTVLINYTMLTAALSAGSGHIILTHNVQHGGTSDAGNQGCQAKAYCYSRQHQALPAKVAAGGEHSQMQCKNDDQHQAQPEVRHGGTEQSKYHASSILPSVLVNSGINAQRNGHDGSNNNSGTAKI